MQIIETVPSWALQEASGEIQWSGAPRNYRADGSTGFFRRGDTNLGNEIKVVIFDYRWIREERWGFPLQVWLDLACIDEEGEPSIISLKKLSASNLFDRILKAKGKRVNFAALQQTLKLVEFVRDDGVFYQTDVAAFDYLQREEFERIQRFKASGQFEYILLGEIGAEEGYGF